MTRESGSSSGMKVRTVPSGHAVYRTMLLSLINIAASVQWLPFGAWGIRAIILGLNGGSEIGIVLRPGWAFVLPRSECCIASSRQSGRCEES